MGLKSELTADIREAFATDLKDAVFDLILKEDTGASRVNGEVVSNPPISHTVDSVEDSGSIFKELTEIEEGTKYLLFIQDDSSIKPEIKMLVEHKGLDYIISGIRNDPADVTWIIKVKLQ